MLNTMVVLVEGPAGVRSLSDQDVGSDGAWVSNKGTVRCRYCGSTFQFEAMASVRRTGGPIQ